MRKTLITITAAFLSFAASSAQDVYAYKAGNSNSVAAASNLQRIEFNTGAIKLVSVGDKETEVSLNDLDYLLFYKKEIINSIRNTSNSKEINIAYDGKQLSVESSKVITSVSVYTSDGIIYASVSPKSKSAKLSLASYPAGIYIVKATAGKEVATNEIVKK